MSVIYQNDEPMTLEDNEIINLYETGQLENNCENGNNDFNIGKYNFIIKNNEEAKKYHLMAIEKGNVLAMLNMGLILKKQNNIDEAKKYYLMAIEKGNSNAMYNMGNLLKEQNELEEAKKYYLMAIEKGHIDAMNNMGWLLNEQNELEEAKKNYLMAIDKGNVLAINNIKKITTPLERYYLYEKHKIHFTEEITRDIHIFKNKISLSSKDDDCIVCYEHTKCISLECCHYLCATCYVKLYKGPCPVCRL